MKTVWCIFFILVSIQVNAQNTRRDGNWWIDKSQVLKVSYALGFLDGISLGRNFTIWNVLEEDKTCAAKASGSFEDHEQKFMANVNSGQLADGLDDFYKDYRNRKILVVNGVWLVLNSIAGTPQKELDKMIESFRANAK
jgi:hypothetical protein